MRMTCFRATLPRVAEHARIPHGRRLKRRQVDGIDESDRFACQSHFSA